MTLPFYLRNLLPKAFVSRKNNSVGRKRRYVVSGNSRRTDALTRRLKLREIELRVQREIHEKRQELLAKEESLR